MRSQRTTGGARRSHTAVLAGLAATALLALLALAGCGGGDDSSATESSAPTGELSASELASTADDICTKSNAVTLDATPPDFGNDGPQSDEVKASAPFWAATADQQQQLLDQLSELQPTADLKQKYDEFLALQRQANVTFALTLQKEAETGDVKKFFAAAADGQKDLRDLTASAQGLGMTVCGASDVPQSSGSAS